MKVKTICFLSIILMIFPTIPTSLAFPAFNNERTSEIHNSNSEAEGVKNAGQELVDYFRWLFYHDWTIGEIYEPEIDGTGFPQSRELKGSSYEPFEPDFITDYAEITPIISPNNSISSIVNLIDSAEQTLDIEQLYIYNSSSQIVDAIKSANDRGVRVRIIIADNDNSKNFADYIGAFENVELRVCTGNVPMYFEQHNKGVIVDNKTFLISSINWSPTSLKENREAGLIIKSIKTTTYYLKLFDHDWSVCVKYKPSEHLKSSISEVSGIKKSTLNLAIDYIEPETFNGTMNMTVMASPDNCYGIVSKLLEKAEKSIDISVYTLSSPYLLDIIREKISQGVKVRLLLEYHPVSYYEQNYNEYAMNNLTVQGVPSADNPEVINKAQGLWNSVEFTFQHCKYSIIDNETLILSSGNWARSSCPKPQPDGDVDGNRDWWIAIYGGNPSDLMFGEDDDFIFKISSFNLVIVIGLIGVISIFISFSITQNKPKK
jgi:phosphatidylserine/phosphatidylglycerophosphate/cardiolipin synthase-like enzyme